MRDAVVVGSGPNGLAAAVTLQGAGVPTLLVEAHEEVGGGARTAELTLPGFRHDVCSAVHPLAAASPFFRTLPLGEHGLEWVQPPVPLAHPLDDGTAVLLHRDVHRTASGLGGDAGAYRRLVAPLARDWDRKLAPAVLGPPRVPRHPLALARFGASAARSASALARAAFRGERARALFAGCAAHSMLPLERSPSAAFGLVLALLAHVAGWPVPRGGAGRISHALRAHFEGIGGIVVTGRRVHDVTEFQDARALLLDLTPREALRVAGAAWTDRYRRALGDYEWGPGAFKVDWALDGPIPWTARECRDAGTLHLGGTLEEVEDAERAPWEGRVAERPLVILSQPTLFDSTRAPAGKHVAWAYCHVPHGWSGDATALIESQVERFAPGFRDLVLARHAHGPVQLERYNPNYAGGDINGGAQGWGQLFTRPVPRLDPYRTSDPRILLCSSATPPGGGVHGMSGYHAARSALAGPLAPQRS